jgi:hypothetical protein
MGLAYATSDRGLVISGPPSTNLSSQARSIRQDQRKAKLFVDYEIDDPLMFLSSATWTSSPGKISKRFFEPPVEFR